MGYEVHGRKLLVKRAGSIPAWDKYHVSVSATGRLTVNGVTTTLNAATEQQIPLFTKPANSVLLAVAVKHSAAFAGGAITGVTASVGTSMNTTAVTDAVNVFVSPSSTTFYQNAGLNIVDFNTVALVLDLVTTGGNLSALAAGALDIWVQTGVLP